jgi:hypothetical protein
MVKEQAKKSLTETIRQLKFYTRSIEMAVQAEDWSSLYVHLKTIDRDFNNFFGLIRFNLGKIQPPEKVGPRPMNAVPVPVGSDLKDDDVKGWPKMQGE